MKIFGEWSGKTAFVLLSAGFTYVLAMGFLPLWTVWGYFALVLAYMLFAKPLQKALEVFILCVPFLFVLPNSYSGSLSMWRLLVIALFLKAFLPSIAHFAINKRFWQDPKTPCILWKKCSGYIKSLEPYEKLFWVFMLVALASLATARFPFVGLGQIVYLLNASLIYPVTVAVLKKGGELKRLVSVLAFSAGSIVAIGFLQLALSIVFPFYTFWQFWASQVAPLFYGREFADVLVYSNSWFTKSGGIESLRMFSIMPSSHAFAMVGVFVLAFLTPVLALRLKRKKIFPITKERYVTGKPLLESSKEFWSGRMPVWYGLRFAGLSVVLSGTRGVWVGMLVPFFASLLLWAKKVFPSFAKLWVMVMSLIILFFVLSPLINSGLNYLRVVRLRENFLDRAASIYDLDEQSNVGRILIWKETLGFTLDHPFGVGYGNFIATLTDENGKYEQAAGEKNKRYNLPQRYVTAHSLYLQLLTELSLLGVLVFLGLWVLYFKRVWAFLMEHKDHHPYETLLVFSISICMLWFLAYSVFDLTWLNDKILLYTFVSMGVVKAVMQKQSNSEHKVVTVVK